MDSFLETRRKTHKHKPSLLQRLVVILLLLPVVLGLLFALYLLKSLFGINLMPEEHLSELIGY